MSLPTEPYSRIERYLAKLAGQDVDIPDKPITRIECYLDYIVTNGGLGAAPNAGGHNVTFRGQSLGTEFTANQSAAITGGTFEGMYIGDYWTINDKVYRIAGFDLFLHTGDTELTAHHAVIVPDAIMYSGPMRTESTPADAGYANTALKTSGLDDALATVKAAFGADHIVSRRALLCTYASSYPTGWAWQTTQIDIMTESQVFGRGAWATQNQSGYNVAAQYSRFPLFCAAPEFITTRDPYWLQDVRSATSFVFVANNGNADYTTNATSSSGVRPFWLVA